MRVVKIDKQTTENILSDLLKRSPNQYDSYADSVQEILDAVKAKGDEALFGYTEKFDGCRLTPETLQVTEEEIDEAEQLLSDPDMRELAEEDTALTVIVIAHRPETLASCTRIIDLDGMLEKDKLDLDSTKSPGRIIR